MTQKFILYGKLPGYNQLTLGNWFVRNRIKKEAMDEIILVIKANKIKPVKGKALVRIICYEPNKRRDATNVRAGIEKLVMDALQIAGIIRNDNAKWLEDIPAIIKYDKNNPRIVIEVEGEV